MTNEGEDVVAARPPYRRKIHKDKETTTKPQTTEEKRCKKPKLNASFEELEYQCHRYFYYYIIFQPIKARLRELLPHPRLHSSTFTVTHNV